MRSSTILVAAFAAISSATAAPSDFSCRSCLCEREAKQTADNVQHFFSHYSDEFTRELFTADAVDYTDSVQFLINNGTNCPKPLGTATFPNRASLSKAQGQQGSIPWEILNVFWDCENVIIRWASKQVPFVVRGIAIFHTVPNPHRNAKFPRKIDHVFSEFNSGAWLVNRGDYQGTGAVPGCKGVVGPVGNSGLKMI